MYSGHEIPDHPVIRNMERTGYPDGKEPEYPHCPSCHEEEIPTVYVSKSGDIIGCDACVTKKYADDVPAFMRGQDGIPVCPICGGQCEDAYFDQDGEIAGCDECVTEKDAWENPDCFHQK